jgi:hypothetical protein
MSQDSLIEKELLKLSRKCSLVVFHQAGWAGEIYIISFFDNSFLIQVTDHLKLPISVDNKEEKRKKTNS